MTDHSLEAMKLNEKRLRLSTWITIVMFFSELVGGFLTNSLAIMSDAWHLLSDLMALLLSWFAIRQTMKPADGTHTYGYHRFGSMAALINGLTLIGISLFIFYKATMRLLEPVQVHSIGMMWLAGIGFAGTLLIVLILRNGQQNINVKSALVHFLGDVFSYFGILAGGLLIQLTGWLLVDPLLSGLFAVIILKNAWTITREAGRILLETVPNGVSVQTVSQRLLQEPEVLKIVDLHIWSLSNEHLSLSAHLQIQNMYVGDTERLLNRLETILLREFQIAHTTIQLQTEDKYRNQYKDSLTPKVH